MAANGATGRYAFAAADASAQAVRQLIAVADPASRNASLNIDGDDDMFTFGVTNMGVPSTVAMSYFRQGMSMVGLLEKVAVWRFGGWAGVGSVLDFAAGYGRSTRFLVQHLPADHVTASEIQAPALEFQRRELGVKTLLSSSDPDELQSPGTFDFVFVASLFTHLPDRTFGSWLAKLWTLVAPGGVLVFSVHDEAINRAGVPLEDGFAFIPRSEVASISSRNTGRQSPRPTTFDAGWGRRSEPRQTMRSGCPERCASSRTSGSCHAGPHPLPRSSTSVVPSA